MAHARRERPVITIGYGRGWSSVETVYATISSILEERFCVKTIPLFIDSLPCAQAAAICADRVGRNPILMLGTELGGMPLRAASHARTPWLYLPLGGLPRGAARLRANLRYLRGGDVIAFSSFADVDMFHNLVATCSAEIKDLLLFVEQDMFRPLDPRRRRDFRRDLGFGAAQVVFPQRGENHRGEERPLLGPSPRSLVVAQRECIASHRGSRLECAFPGVSRWSVRFAGVMHEVMEVSIEDRGQNPTARARAAPSAPRRLWCGGRIRGARRCITTRTSVSPRSRR